MTRVADRATQIIDRHRTMPKSRQLDKKRIDLRAVIDETLVLIAHDMSARQVEAAVDLPSRQCVVDGDQVLLQQVFVNLVMNAVDAMAETLPARRHLTISGDGRATDVDVCVRDTGSGLPAHILDTLFTPFVTTKARGPRDRPDDRTVDRRCAWRDHRRPQQPRRGRNIYGDAAA